MKYLDYTGLTYLWDKITSWVTSLVDKEVHSISNITFTYSSQLLGMEYLGGGRIVSSDSSFFVLYPNLILFIDLSANNDSIISNDSKISILKYSDNSIVKEGNRGEYITYVNKTNSVLALKIEISPVKTSYDCVLDIYIKEYLPLISGQEFKYNSSQDAANSTNPSYLSRISSKQFNYFENPAGIIDARAAAYIFNYEFTYNPKIDAITFNYTAASIGGTDDNIKLKLDEAFLGATFSEYLIKPPTTRTIRDYIFYYVKPAWIDTKYTLPNTGIPSTDLDSSVLSALTKANSALLTQIQADWNESDSDDAAYIWNKPSVPAFDNIPTEDSMNWVTSHGIFVTLNSALGELNSILEAINYGIYQDTIDYDHPYVEGETVNIHVATKSGAVLSAESGIEVTRTIGNTVTHYTTDSNGNVSILIPFGQLYTLSIEERTGYYVSGSNQRTYTAQLASRAVVFVYHSYSSGLFIVDAAGDEYTLDEWQDEVENNNRNNSEALYIKVATLPLMLNNSTFMLSIDMISERTAYVEGSIGIGNSVFWRDRMVTFNSVPSNGYSVSALYYYDGYTASVNIQNEGDLITCETPAFDLVLAQSVTIGTQNCPGFMGSAGLWLILWDNVVEFDDILDYVRPNGTYKLSTYTINKFTSTQVSAWQVVAVSNLMFVMDARSRYTVIPFFAY